MTHTRLTLTAVALTTVWAGGAALADVTMYCSEMGLSVFHADINTVLGAIPVAQAENLAGPPGQARINVFAASDCDASVAGYNVGTTDFIRVTAEHKDNPPTGEAGAGLIIPVAAYVTSHSVAEHAPHAFTVGDFEVDFQGVGPRNLHVTFPGGGDLKVEYLRFEPDGGIPLAAKDFFILHGAEQPEAPNMRCGWDTVGWMIGSPDPVHAPEYTGQSPILASADPVMAMKLKDIECVYRFGAE